MAKFKADQLQEMIRAIVRQEIREVVSTTINEVLSERYLKQLAESALARPRGVGPTMHIQGDDDQEEEDVPQVLKNEDDGIFYQHPIKHDDSVNEGRRAANLPRNEMLSLFFEGTKPLDEMEAQADSGVPIQAIEEKIASPNRFKELLEGANQRALEKGPMKTQKDPAAEEARLRALRESLERPV